MHPFATLTPLSDLAEKIGRLWRPSDLYTPTEPGQGKDLMVFDPVGRGYDGKLHKTAGILTQEADSLVYASGGTANANLSKNRVITGICLVADPYQHDVTTGTITVVQDAQDKLLSGLNISGGPTYFNLNSTLTFLKAIGALQKSVRPGMEHDDLATAVANDNQSYQAWQINFGLDDLNPFDFRAGIPAQDETSLILGVTFATSNLIAATSANGTIDTNTRVYVLTYGVQGLSPRYRRFLPIPDFKHDHVTSPTTNTRFNLQTNRRLKRTTILNLAVAASNNEARNDSNITDISLVFQKPTDTRVFNLIRWRSFRAAQTAWVAGVPVDFDGAAAVNPTGLAGVSVIDWSKWTANPYGLSTYNFNDGDIFLEFTMGTTTGSIHLYHEYYSLPQPDVARRWDRRPVHSY